MAEHGPATDWGEDKAAAYKARLGLRLFVAYSLMYAGFVLINTINPSDLKASFKILKRRRTLKAVNILVALFSSEVYNFSRQISTILITIKIVSNKLYSSRRNLLIP